MQTINPLAPRWGERLGKEGTQMTLIWKSLLHANFRCGRMYSARAEKQTLSHSCTVPSMPRMCERM